MLDTSDDFLAAGVECEEAAGKWHAGDAAKSLRFFQRAVETYDQGLRSFPRSLDLAYNKARVQLEVSTHPLLIPQLQTPLLEALRETLSWHRNALDIDSSDANTLFNTAQVLTTIAERLSTTRNEAIGEALELLDEALELQSKCLRIQESKFEESERRGHAIETSDPEDTTSSNVSTENANDLDAAEAQWFSVEEPTTLETLIDTALAQLATLTTLCSIISSTMAAQSTPSLLWIENFSRSILNERLAVYSHSSDLSRQQEIALAKSTFVSVFLEASFHQHAIDEKTYKIQRDSAFQATELQLEHYPDGLIRNAESLMAFSSALSDNLNEARSQHGATKWGALNAAITNLVTASKLEVIDNDSMSKTHVLRGECSLLLWRLSHPPIDFKPAVENAKQLLKNAEVFYRNASRLIQDEDGKASSSFRSSIAGILQNPNAEQAALSLKAHESGWDWVKQQIADMVDEDLIPLDFGRTLCQL